MSNVAGEPCADFTRYNRTIDQNVARYDSGSGEMHVLAVHPYFQNPDGPPLTSRQARELAIKQAALRIAVGYETRPLRTVAREIGCYATAIDNALKKICAKVGVRKGAHKVQLMHTYDPTKQPGQPSFMLRDANWAMFVFGYDNRRRGQRNAFTRFIQRNNVPHIRTGQKTFRFKEAAVLEWLARQTNSGAA